MNYLRGAVNAISAPYQYYKDLPPINPATLTGAIDVIVIQRPTDNGSTELACSPFHVRFGKLQVLRPSDKKVTVSVNGRPIPFDMKIGEAGEAFFVFETDDDVPDDLITSPLLKAKAEGKPGDDAEVGLGKHNEPKDEQLEPDYLDLDATDQEKQDPIASGSLPSPPPSPAPKNQKDKEYPDDETAAQKEADERADAALKRETGKEVHVPQVLHQDGIAIDSEGYHSQPRRTHYPTHKEHYESYYHGRERSDRTIRGIGDDNEDSYWSSDVKDVDPDSETSSQDDSPGAVPFPTYRATSEPPPEIDAVDFDPPNEIYAFTPSPSTPNTEHTTNPLSPDEPSDPLRSVTTPKPRHKGLPGMQLQLPPQEYSWEWGGFPTPSPMKASFNFGKGGRPVSSILGSGPAGPSRVGGHHASSSISANASTWARSNTLSLEGGRDKGKAKLQDLFGHEGSFLDTVDESRDGEQAEDIDVDTPDEDVVKVGGRSRSVPPGFEGSPTNIRRRTSSMEARRSTRNNSELDDDNEIGRSGKDKGKRRASDGAGTSAVGGGFGAGGLLSASRSDPTQFRVFIEGKMMEFELSLVERKITGKHGEDEDEDDQDEEPRGRSTAPKALRKPKLRVFSPDGRWSGIDEFEMTWLFDRGKIDFDRFLNDEGIARDPRLVIRWTGEKYISRHDESPLMDALVLWRDACLKAREAGLTRPSSPFSDEEVTTPTSTTRSTTTLPTSLSSASLASMDEKRLIERSQSEPPESVTAELDNVLAKKPPTSTSWVQWWSRSRKTEEASITPAANPASPSQRPGLKEVYSAPPFGDLPAVTKPRPQPTESAPALPSTPVQKPKILEPVPSMNDEPKKYVKTLRLTSDQLKSLNLKPGANTITFSLSVTGAIACTARIFVWDSSDQVVISDIDGTITKSDGLGHVFAMIGRDWTHLGVAKLYTDICRNGYKMLYLTSRAIGQADATRGYLKGIKQNDYQLPEGPVIMSPDRLMTSLHREVIMRKPEVFKMACLRDIQRLFGDTARRPFYAGFGNRITDALSYRSVNVPSSRIFTIDSAGEVKCELLELAGYKSSYIHMTDLVDQMFPPINRKWAPEFTDFNYWKAPMQEFPLPDLSPPSPALSARSDTSNRSALARLRNFSLVGSRQASGVPAKITRGEDRDGDLRDLELRQMSSFERLRDTLGFSPSRSVSPERPSSSSSMWGDSDSEDEGGVRRRERRRSMTSMPGSLEDMQFGMDDEEEEEEGHEDDDYDEHDGQEDLLDEDAVEEAFDEDILAAGEMKNVPFL
ncbi:lipin Ned1 [Marasmius crinis-equi]|uniref:phosphatidate phosphatase n=1 Tax=Marasmius crinis-equi TaxID=585013 RepID=A0ABR3FZC9_9AGAR